MLFFGGVITFISLLCILPCFVCSTKCLSEHWPRWESGTSNQHQFLHRNIKFLISTLRKSCSINFLKNNAANHLPAASLLLCTLLMFSLLVKYVNYLNFVFKYPSWKLSFIQQRQTLHIVNKILLENKRNISLFNFLFIHPPLSSLFPLPPFPHNGERVGGGTLYKTQKKWMKNRQRKKK